MSRRGRLVFMSADRLTRSPRPQRLVETAARKSFRKQPQPPPGRKAARAGGRAFLFSCALACGLLSATAPAQTTNAPDEWAWMAGPTTADQPGVDGTLRTPAPGNIPARRDSATTWTDSQGNIWLFGGIGHSATGTVYLDDLWEFAPLHSMT